MDESIIKKEPLGNGFFINVSKHHTFGTDAVLLADFAHAKKADKLVDLGTGCGIIPFLMLRDGNLKTAVGVDISAEAIGLAAKTAEENGDYTTRLALLEEIKCYPFGAVFDYMCELSGVPIREKWLNDVRTYEKDVLFKR